MRIVQDGSHVKMHLDDGKYTRTRCRHGCDDDERFISWARAEDCANGKAESKADLRGTLIKFPSNVESIYVAKGHLSRGGAEVSMDRQLLTVETGGYCGHTYIADDQKDLLEVQF